MHYAVSVYSVEADVFTVMETTSHHTKHTYLEINKKEHSLFKQSYYNLNKIESSKPNIQ